MDEKEIRLKISLLSEIPEANQQLLSMASTLKELGLMSESSHQKIKLNVQSEMTERARLRIALEQEKQSTAELNLAKQKEITIGKELTVQSRKIAQETAAIRKQTGAFTKELQSMQGQLKAAFSFYVVRQFTESIIDAKTQMDRVKVGLENMLGSKAKADALLAQVRDLALNSPMNFQDLADVTFKMIALGFETEKVVPIMKALGNMAAVVGNDKLPLIAKAMSDVRSKNTLMAQEVRQFTDNGVNLYDLLSKSMGKTREEVIKMANDHKIYYADIEKAILKASEVGGIYHNQMVIQSELVGGQVERMRESYQLALASIGDYYEKELRKGIKATAELIDVTIGSEEAIKRTVNVLKSVVGSWLAYQTVTKGAAIAQSAYVAIQKVSNIVKGEAILATEAYTGMTIASTTAQIGAKNAAIALNAALRANPFTLVATALASLVAVYYGYKAINQEVIDQDNTYRKQQSEKISGLLTEKEKAEELLMVVADGNKSMEDRRVAFEELKAQYPEQMKGINNVTEAAERQGDLFRALNKDFETRKNLIIAEIKLERERAKQIELVNRQLDIQERMKSANRRSTTVVVGTSGRIETFESEYDKLAEELSVITKEVNKQVKSVLDLEKQYESTYKTAKKEIVETGNSFAESEKDKRTKTALTAAEIKKITTSILKDEKESFDERKANLDAWLKHSIEVANKSGDDKIKVEKKVHDITVEYKENLSKLEQEFRDDSIKYDQDLIESINNVNEKREDEIRTIEISGERERELTELIDNRGKVYEFISDSMISKNMANSVSMKMFGKAIDNLNIDQLGHLLEKLKDIDNGLEEMKKKAQEAIYVVNSFAHGMLSIVRNELERQSKLANTATEKVVAEHKKALVSIGESSIDVLSNFASGNIVEGVVGGIKTIFMALDEWVSHAADMQEARLEELRIKLAEAGEAFMEYAEMWTSTISGDTVQSIYSDFIIPEIDLGRISLGEYDTAIGIYQQEVKIGQQILKNYDLAVSRENDYYNQRIKSIEDVYNKEVESINAKYDLLDAKANQRKDADTLAIKQKQTDELLALVSTEDTKTSLISEYAAKRSSIIQTFALADQEITENTDQATIDAINASIAARDAALNDLQDWINDELEFVVNSEDGKRREYSVTEEIRRKAEDAIAEVQLGYQADEIQRIKDRETEIVEAEDRKNTAIETEAERHNGVLVSLGQAKDAALAESFEILKKAITDGYDDIIRKAQEAANAGKITAEQYNKLASELIRIQALLGGIGNTITIPNINLDNILNNIPRFSKGAEMVDPTNKYPAGTDTVLAWVDKREGILNSGLNAKKLAAGLNNEQAISYAIEYKDMMSRGDLSFTNPNYDLSFVRTQTLSNKEIVKELKSMRGELKNLKQINVQVKNGRPDVTERRSSRTLKYTNGRYNG